MHAYFLFHAYYLRGCMDIECMVSCTLSVQNLILQHYCMHSVTSYYMYCTCINCISMYMMYHECDQARQTRQNSGGLQRASQDSTRRGGGGGGYSIFFYFYAIKNITFYNFYVKRLNKPTFKNCTQ